MTADDAEGLAGKRVLVTGGTRGIGAAAARALGDAGARIVVSARASSDNCPFPVVVADLGTRTGVERAAADVLSRLGGVDVLISNVGGQIRRSGVLAFTDEDWQQELEVNLLSAVRLDRALAPGMVEQRSGVIVHIGSGAAGMGRPVSVAYSASKAALTVYSKALATDLGPYGIRVNVVVPGFVVTSRIAELAAERQAEPGDVAGQIAQSLDIPLGRAGEPDEAAELIRFLASDRASYLTGAQFAVDGGAYPTV